MTACAYIRLPETDEDIAFTRRGDEVLVYVLHKDMTVPMQPFSLEEIRQFIGALEEVLR